MKSVSNFWSVFSRNRIEYSVSLRIESECGKIRTRKTPNTDTIYTVVVIILLLATKRDDQNVFKPLLWGQFWQDFTELYIFMNKEYIYLIVSFFVLHNCISQCFFRLHQICICQKRENRLYYLIWSCSWPSASNLHWRVKNSFFTPSNTFESTAERKDFLLLLYFLLLFEKF